MKPRYYTLLYLVITHTYYTCTWLLVFKWSICLLNKWTQNCLQRNTIASSSVLNLGTSLQDLSIILAPTPNPRPSSLDMSSPFRIDYHYYFIYSIDMKIHYITYLIFLLSRTDQVRHHFHVKEFEKGLTDFTFDFCLLLRRHFKVWLEVIWVWLDHVVSRVWPEICSLVLRVP